MAGGNSGDSNVMTNGPENTADVPSSALIEPAQVSAESDTKRGASGKERVARPWGLWATMGWTVLCLVVLFVLQIAVEMIFVIVRLFPGPGVRPDDLSAIGAELSINGNMLAAATLASTPAVVGLVALLVWIRGCPIREYLALKWPSARSLFLAMAGLAVVLAGSDLTSYLLGRPLVPKIMVDFYRNAWPPLLVFAVVVLAPLGEEILFRGFLYKGIAASRAGPITAIIVSTITFALLHFQYDWYGVLGVALMGLYLGIVRYGGSSLLLTMLLHAIANVAATVEVFIQLHWGG
jgi:CAAX protease family protein